uniref:Large ribosomal subunit protein bL36c n=1 Tax=Gastrodia flexistyla TaxID=2974002 RepID=A0A976YHD2_9ASPA|nr:ribosomal protein L36 [Gastrodia flexistyla]UVG40858.1 ribosomal protein L36 [Gastrodia flexistyla]
MKIKSSVRKVCNKCRLVRRRGHFFIICYNSRHKYRQK